MPKKTTKATSSQKSEKPVITSEEKKSISIDVSVYNTMLKIKDEMSKKLGGKITFNMVVQSLLNDHNDLKNMQSELNEIKTETESTQVYIKNMLELALQSKSQTIMTVSPQQMNSMSQGFPQPPAPPMLVKPPLSPEEIEKKKKLLDDISKKTTEIKSQYVSEIKVVFDGTLRKPSEILKITNPSHKDKEVKDEIEGNESKVIDIFNKSVVAKNPEKFKNSEAEEAENV